LNQSRKLWMRWRVRIGYPVAVIYWVLAAPVPRTILVGGFLAAVGLLIRGAASGHLQKDKELATRGPYARTRNPLYLGSAFLAAGFVVAGRSWWAGGLVALYFAVFYYAVIRNEEEDLRERFGAAFDIYTAQVPLFFPRFVKQNQGPRGKGAGGFSWVRYHCNREYNALVGTLAGLALMWLRFWLRMRLGY
jgi:protein-S-isoprenylcysteine O-methyltransferase Ste14